MISKIISAYKKLARLLGRINTRIILSVIYFIVIPIFKAVLFFKKTEPSLFFGAFILYTFH